MATMGNVIWGNWNVNATGGTGSITYEGICWPAWNQYYTDSTGGTQAVTVSYNGNQLWVNWNEAYQPAVVRQQIDPDAAYNAHVAAQEKKRLEAEERAEELLMLYLTPEQRKSYKAKGYFETDVNDRRYRLYKGSHGNIRQLDKKGKEVARWCVNAEGVPHSDNVLAQFLALTTDEQYIMQKANITRC